MVICIAVLYSVVYSAVVYSAVVYSVVVYSVVVYSIHCIVWLDVLWWVGRCDPLTIVTPEHWTQGWWAV